MSAGDLKKARDAGFYTCDALLMNTTKRLCEIKGLSEAKIEKILAAAKQICGKGVGFLTARELEIQRERDIGKKLRHLPCINDERIYSYHFYCNTIKLLFLSSFYPLMLSIWNLQSTYQLVRHQ